MKARDEILSAVAALRRRSGVNEFTVPDVIEELARRGSPYAPSTIRTHIVSRMCLTAPDHHARVYYDFERVGPGRYRQRGDDADAGHG